MAGNDDVTVIIPCFNHGAFLGEAVESVLSQDGGVRRVIVIDDGSTEPETAQAIAALPDSVEVVRRPNGGHSAARNTGAAMIETPLMLMVDADDRIPRDCVATLRRPLDADPELGYAYGIMKFFGAWSKEITFGDFDPYKLLYRPIVGWLGLIRTEAYRDAGGFDPDLGGSDDWDWTLSALERGWRGRRVPKVVLHYRKHSRSMLEGDRANFRWLYRKIRDKHADLYARADEFAAESDLGPLGRAFYRYYWAKRPLPARLERAIYGVLFR